MEIKFQEKGYGQGFHDGQMQERKYWQEANKKYIIRMTDEQYTKVIELVECDINKKWKDKIKAKIEKIEKELEDIELKNINKDEISKTTFYFIDRLKCKIDVLQSLLEE